MSRQRTPLTHRNLPLLLLQTRERVLAQFRPLLHANGLTEQQWRIIRALLETGPQEPRQIVALCGISSPSLAGVLGRMEEMGLVTRERITHDLRRQIITLTPHSHALAARMAPEVDAAYAELAGRLGEERLQKLFQALDGVLAGLDQAEPGQA